MLKIAKQWSSLYLFAKRVVQQSVWLLKGRYNSLIFTEVLRDVSTNWSTVVKKLVMYTVEQDYVRTSLLTIPGKDLRYDLKILLILTI